MRNLLRLLLVSALAFTFVSAGSAATAAEQQALQIQDCSTSPINFCIKEFSVKRKSDLLFTRGALTGLKIPINQVGPGGLKLQGIRQEYVTPGISYEGYQNEKIIPIVEYYPNVTVPCSLITCLPAREMIAVFVSPSGEHDPWQNRLVESPYRFDSKYCSSDGTPQLCTKNLSFGTEVDIKMQLQIPSDYIITFIHGLASGFTYTIEPSTVEGFSLLTFQFSPIEHAGMLSPAWGKNSAGEDGGDFITDTTALWFFGKNDMWSKSIGPCAGSGAYGVVNNAVDMGEPRWNQEDRTLSVRLSAPHVNSKNEVIKGYFGAFVSRKMAECLWKLDISKESSARLAVSYSDGGNSEVLTAVSSFNNDLFTLETAGFHYSSPTIRVKLESNSPTTSPSPTAAPSVPKRTILCIKGRVVKSFTSQAPQCPKGYKTK